MKYLVPPIVIPILLCLGIAGYAVFKPPIVNHHPLAPTAITQPR